MTPVSQSHLGLMLHQVRNHVYQELIDSLYKDVFLADQLNEEDSIHSNCQDDAAFDWPSMPPSYEEATKLTTDHPHQTIER